MFTRLGAPRRLLTSRQGRTERGAGPLPDERVEEWRQAGQSSGVRGLRRRWTVVRMALALEWGGVMEPGQVPKPRQAEAEEDHEQEQEHRQGHQDPRYLK